MKKIIVIPVTGGILSGHFGHCEEFYFAEIVDNKINKEYKITPPEHEPGLYPKWVKEQGGTLVIAGGMGKKACALFDENGVEVITGAVPSEPRQVVENYLADRLEVTQNSCDH